MNEPRPPAITPDEDALFAFGDDPNAAPAYDLEATVRLVQHATGLDAARSSSIPTDLKHQIWEDLMHTQTANPSLPSPTAHRISRTATQREDTRSSPTGHGLVLSRPHDSRIVRAVVRWQPAVSLAIVIGFLVGLVGIAYQRGIWNEPNPAEPSGAASQVMYDSDDASTYPEVPAQCATNGPVKSDEFYMDISIKDLPQPEYTPVQAVTPEAGERIQDTYLRFARCQYESIENFPYPEATPTTYSDALTPLTLSYFSGQARLALLYPALNASQQDEIDTQQCAAIEEILAGFPLPLNQPHDYALISSTVDNLPNVTWLAFAPSDVYLLPDGRFGAIMGSVSTAALVDPASATLDDQLTFVAFVEQDGRYLIDEDFVVFSGGAEQTANPFFPAASLCTLWRGGAMTRPGPRDRSKRATGILASSEAGIPLQ